MLLWSVVPPPLYALWLVGVGASEWGLWPGALGLSGAVLGLRALRRFGSEGRRGRRECQAAVILGLLSALVSLLPLLQTLPVARANGVALSLRHYLFGDDATGATPVRRETVTYSIVGKQSLALDVYRTQGNDPAAPAIIVVHGGSWRGGDKSDFAHWDRWLAARGYVVFDIQYRLRPQPNWREATGDVKAAVGWVRRNATRYRADPTRLALLGRSAGGHLALLAAYTTGVPALPPSDGTADTSVRAVISFYGPTDLAWGYNNPAVPDVIDGPGTLHRFLGGTPLSSPNVYRIASPIHHVGPATPPTLLFHGERDLLVGPQHTSRLSARLTAAGVPHRTVFFPYALHGFDFHQGGWGSQVAQPVLLRFLREHLGH